MYLFSELVDTILHLFNLIEVIFLTLISEFLKLLPLLTTQLMRPLDAQVLSYLTLAQMRHSLLNLVELLIFKELVCCQDLLSLRQIAVSDDQVFEFGDPSVLFFSQYCLRHFCRMVLSGAPTIVALLADECLLL